MHFSFVSISDLQLGKAQYGSPTREEDFYMAAYDAAEKIRDAGPEFLIIAGDLFESGDLSFRTLEAVEYFLDRTGVEKKYVIGGNHDRGKHGYEALDYLYRRGMITFLDSPQEWAVFTRYPHKTTVQIHGISYAGPSTDRLVIRKSQEVLDRMALYPENEVWPILALHYGYPGQRYDSLSSEALLMAKRAFKMVVAGHHHYPFSDGFWYQAGATEVNSVKEAPFQKDSGYYYFDVDTDRTPQVEATLIPTTKRHWIVDDKRFAGDVDVYQLADDIKTAVQSRLNTLYYLTVHSDEALDLSPVRGVIQDLYAVSVVRNKVARKDQADLPDSLTTFSLDNLIKERLGDAAYRFFDQLRARVPDQTIIDSLGES